MVLLLPAIALLPSLALAGGGPASVLVLHNADDAESTEIAEYYMDARDIPPGQLCGIGGVDPSSLTIDLESFQTQIQAGLLDCLSTLPDPDEIDYLVLTRGLPLRVDIPSGFHTSTQAMLQVGAGTRDDSPLAGQAQSFSGGTAYASVHNPLWPGSGGTSAYTLSNPSALRYTTGPKLVSMPTLPRAFSRQHVSASGGTDLTGEMFLVSRLDGFDVVDALDLVDRAVEADGSFPEAPITCMAAADSARGARDPECAFVVQMLDGAGIPAQWIDTHDPLLSGHEMSAYLTGTTSLQDGIEGNSFVPGAFAGNLTSYGAVPQNWTCDGSGDVCPASESQTSIARFVRGGLTGVHGTVAEPLNNSFPGAGMLLLYTAGYNMIESAQTTQVYLYWQNLYLGDPLTSPWAERPVVSLSEPSSLPLNEALELIAEHPDGIAELRLYVDGERVASSDGDTLELLLDGEEGDTLDILAIAISADATISRPGWPEPEPIARPQIQGWTTARIVLGPPSLEAPDTSAPLDTAEPTAQATKPEGCACSSGGVPGSTAWLPLLALGAARRRRSARPLGSTHTAL